MDPMWRKVGLVGLILAVTGFLMILFTYPYGLRRQGDATSYFYFHDTNVCRVSLIGRSSRFATGQLAEICIYQVEIDHIPERGLRILLGAEIRRRGLEFHKFAVTREWIATFPPNQTTLPIEMIIPITGSVTEQDLNLTRGEQIEISLTTYEEAYVLLEGNEVQDLGQYRSSHFGYVISLHPIIAFVSNNLLGMSIAITSVGIIMLVATLVVASREEG